MRDPLVGNRCTHMAGEDMCVSSKRSAFSPPFTIMCAKAQFGEFSQSNNRCLSFFHELIKDHVSVFFSKKETSS